MSNFSAKSFMINHGDQVNITKYLVANKTTIKAIYKKDKNLLIQLADGQVVLLEGFYKVDATLVLGNGRSLQAGRALMLKIEEGPQWIWRA